MYLLGHSCNLSRADPHLAMIDLHLTTQNHLLSQVQLHHSFSLGWREFILKFVPPPNKKSSAGHWRHQKSSDDEEDKSCRHYLIMTHLPFLRLVILTLKLLHVRIAHTKSPTSNNTLLWWVSARALYMALLSPIVCLTCSLMPCK